MSFSGIAALFGSMALSGGHKVSWFPARSKLELRLDTDLVIIGSICTRRGSNRLLPVNLCVICLNFESMLPDVP